jgi:choline-sulfatase
MSDEHASMYSGAYGHPFVRTPNIDALAARGVTFDAAYCNSPICAPARASFLTGLLPSRSGLWSNGLPLASDLPTWAHHASAAGYESVLIGKQHFAGPDQTHGFERRLVEEVHSTRIRPFSYVSGGPDPEHFFRAGPGDTQYIQHDLRVTDEAVRYLRERDRSRPFALCVSLFAPHFPFIAPAEHWDGYFPHLADLPDGFGEPEPALHPAWEALRDLYQTRTLDGDRVRRLRAAYYALSTFMDECLGRVLAALEASGEAEDTIVIYTSDHGEHLGRRGLWLKKTFFEESVRVPLVIAGAPLPVAPGSRRGQVVSLADVAATIIDVVGGEPPVALDGSPLTALLRDGYAPWVDRALSEFYGLDEMQLLKDRPEAWLPRRMIRHGRYKLSLLGSRDSLELYDLESDPEERRDLSGDQGYAAVRDRLLAEVTVDWDPDEVLGRVRSTFDRCALIMRAESTYLGEVPRAMGMPAQKSGA